ncbi:unnamed protein product, partial [Prorocentrum cordatum]
MPALREGAAVTASAAGLRVKASILGRDASPFGNPQRFPVFPKVERPSRRWGADFPAHAAARAWFPLRPPARGAAGPDDEVLSLPPTPRDRPAARRFRRPLPPGRARPV